MSLTEYNVNSGKIRAGIIFLWLLIVFMAVLDVSFVTTKNSPLANKYLLAPAMLLLMIFFIFMLYLRMKYLSKTQNMQLRISPQDNLFYFGYKANMTEYNKANITEINIIGGMTNKGPNLLNIMEVCFNDGSKIIVPAMVIYPYTFKDQFPGIKFNVLAKPIANYKAWWEYAIN